MTDDEWLTGLVQQARWQGRRRRWASLRGRLARMVGIRWSPPRSEFPTR